MKSQGHVSEKLARDFLNENPDLKQAMEVFRITQEQYTEALRSLNSPEIHSSNSLTILVDSET